jgi:hypothetical protein
MKLKTLERTKSVPTVRGRHKVEAARLGRHSPSALGVSSMRRVR